MTTRVLNGPALERPAKVKAGPGGIVGLVRAVLGALSFNALANTFFFLAMVIGFLHGWLKMRYPHPLMTFAYDIPMSIALVFVLLKLKRKQSLFPSSRVSTAIQLLVALSVVYALLPFGVPWLVRLSSFRGWCFAPLMMLLGYHLIRSVRQVEVFVWMMILLGAGTAAYGIFFQSEAEVRSMMAANADLSSRLTGTFYSGSQGTTFRHFSTYVTAAVFGSVMAICATFAISRMLVPGATVVERLALLVCGSLCSYALVLTGSRTSMLLLIMGVVLSAVFSKGGFRFLLLPVLLALPVAVGVVLVGGAAAERFGELLNPFAIWSRVYIVVGPGIGMILNDPFGGGLGRSGHGVPFSFAGLFRDFEFRATDGDIGRVMSDFGLPGLLVYAVLLYSGTSDSIRWMWRLRDSNLSVIAAPAGSMFLLALAQVFTGSPFLGIPAGMLVWILFGGLRRLVEEYERKAATEGEAVEDLPEFVSFISRKKMSSIFQGGPIQLTEAFDKRAFREKFVEVGVAPRGGAALPESRGAKTRFLFRREPKKAK